MFKIIKNEEAWLIGDGVGDLRQHGLIGTLMKVKCVSNRG